MKKILLVLVLLFIPKVHALTYTDYSDYSEFTENEVQGTDLIDVKTENRYRYYKLEKVIGNYGEKGYDYVDYNDYILSKESEMSLTKPNEKDRVINEKYGYEYKRVSPVNFIKITNKGSYISMKNIKIYDGNSQITEIDTRGFSSDNDIVPFGRATINENGFIIIEFHEMHYLDNLKISMIINGTNVKYKFEAGENRAYVSSDFDYGNISDYNDTFEFKNASLESPNYEYFYDLKKDVSNVLMTASDLLTFYTYQDKIYRPYNLNKIYNYYYTKDAVGDFIYKDENDYKTYYSYRTRDIIKDAPIKENTFTNTTSDIVKVPNTSKNDISYLIYFIIFAFLSTLILVLSKHYKKTSKRAKV